MPYPPNDGGAIASLSMIEGFMHAGDEVQVLSMQTHKHSFSISELPERLTKQITWHQQWMNTQINYFTLIWNVLFSSKPYNATRFYSRNFAERLKKILNENSFDIIQLESLYVTPYIAEIRKYSKATIALRAHNVEYEIWERLAANSKNIFKRRYFNLLAKRMRRMELAALAEIDLLVPITQRDADILSLAKPENVFVCPTGISTDAIVEATPAKSNTVFYIGALDWLPNQEGLLWFLEKVWKKLIRNYPQWEFVIAGRNASPGFEQKLRMYPVNYVGQVENARDFILEHHIMVVPLWSGSGMRIKIIEGMACSKCVLTTSLGAEGIAATSGTDIFIGNSADEFIDNLSHLFENPETISQVGKNAGTFVKKHYDNQQLIAGLSGFYKSKIGLL
jgi:glycosyltransferase involved in cell wall biosynthesis